MKKILFFGTQIATGGAQKLLLQQCNYFYKNGYDVLAVFLYSKEDLLNKWRKLYPFRIISLNSWSTDRVSFSKVIKLIKGIFRLIYLLITEKISIIETFTYESNLIGIPFAWLFRVPIRIATFHGLSKNPSRIFLILHGLIINLFASKLVLVSKHLEKFAIRDEKIKPNKLITITNGIDLPKLNKDPMATRKQIRDELKLKPIDNVFISVGRLCYEKDHKSLLLAIAKIVVVYPNIKVLIVGDGEENEKLVGLSKKLKIETNVIFLGFRSNIMELLIASDFFIMTSVSEGYPLVLIEAKIVGLPIITTDFDGVENIIEDGVNGLIAEMKNPDHIAEKAIELLNCKDLQKRLSKSNSAQIKSTEQMCAEYLDLFEQLECN